MGLHLSLPSQCLRRRCRRGLGVALAWLGASALAALPAWSQVPGGGPQRIEQRLLMPVCTELRKDDSDDFVTSVAFAADGRHLLVGCRHGAVELRSVEGRLLIRQQPDAECVQSVRVAPDGSWMASASQAMIRRWSRDGQPIGSFGTGTATITALAIAPDGRSLLSGHADGTANLWRLDGSRITAFGVSRPFGLDGHVVAVTFTPLGDEVVLGFEKGTVVRRALAGASLAEIETGIDVLRSVAFAAGGELLAGGLWSQGLRRWDAAGRQLAPLREGSSIEGLRVVEQGRAVLLAGVEVDPYLERRRLDGSAPLRLDPAPTSVQSEQMAVSPDDRVVAVADGRYITLWDLP